MKGSTLLLGLLVSGGVALAAKKAKSKKADSDDESLIPGAAPGGETTVIPEVSSFTIQGESGFTWTVYTTAIDDTEDGYRYHYDVKSGEKPILSYTVMEGSSKKVLDKVLSSNSDPDFLLVMDDLGIVNQ